LPNNTVSLKAQVCVAKEMLNKSETVVTTPEDVLQLLHPMASAFPDFYSNRKQGAAVLTAKGRIAAVTYRIRLRILTARPISPILYNGPGYAPKTVPSHRSIRPLFVGYPAVTNRTQTMELQ